LILAGDIPFAQDRFETDKSIKDEELKTLISSELWKKEEQKKKPAAKKEEEAKAE
jgi:hypothetical protein